jgi:hypothetical protein
LIGVTFYPPFHAKIKIKKRNKKVDKHYYKQSFVNVNFVLASIPVSSYFVAEYCFDLYQMDYGLLAVQLATA